MIETPIEAGIVRKHIIKSGLKCVGRASIREINQLVIKILKDTRKKFIRMEIGGPGFASPQICIDAEIEALKRGVGSIYPPFEGVTVLKTEISRFVDNFMNLKVKPDHCFPTVGSMQGCYIGLMVSTRRKKDKRKILFIEPGFQVNKLQARIIGIESECLEVYRHRGDKLRLKLERCLGKGDIGAMIYSTPNNPTWMCLTEKELKIIGELCTKYDVIALEDLAYFGMDFRCNYSKPGVEPFIPTVAKYTDNYILFISSSKLFSFAGQRIGMTVISEKLYNRKYSNLEKYFATRKFGHAFIYGGIYAISAGSSHSAQYGLASILKAVNDGEYNFIDNLKEYGERSREMKRLFTDNGFKIVYELDEDKPVADGFYFTITYPGMRGAELVEELLYYGISTISLCTTGKKSQEGIRACVSMTGKERFAELNCRLKLFNENQKKRLRAIDLFKNRVEKDLYYEG